jgi:hypothetical protein
VSICFADKCFDDWDVINAADLPTTCNVIDVDDGRSLIATMSNKWGNNAADKAVSAFQRFIHGLTSKSHTASAIGTSHPIYDDLYKTKWKQPLGQLELHNFLDSDGRIVQLNELKQRIFEGGIEPGLRKIIWRYLLNIYPHNISSKQRMIFLKSITSEYTK